jgi:hypothetical protein
MTEPSANAEVEVDGVEQRLLIQFRQHGYEDALRFAAETDEADHLLAFHGDQIRCASRRPAGRSSLGTPGSPGGMLNPFITLLG